MSFGLLSCSLTSIHDIYTTYTSIAIANLWWTSSKNLIEHWTFHGLYMVIRSACLLNPKLNTWVFQILFTIDCVVVNAIWRYIPISLNMFVGGWFVLWSSPNHTPMKCKWPIKSNNQIMSTYHSSESGSLTLNIFYKFLKCMNHKHPNTKLHTIYYTHLMGEKDLTLIYPT